MKKVKPPIPIIFFGTQEFAAAILQGLMDGPDFEIKLAITQPDKPAGRKQESQKSPVKVMAEKRGLKINQPATLKNYKLPTDNCELGIVVQYGLLIPQHILAAPKYGILNIHPSLLPKYRGASPIQSAILNGETQTGITIMKMDEGLDTGPIILQKQAQIGPEQTYPILTQRLAQIASSALTEAIQGYLSGQIRPQPQDSASATLCHEFKREDGQIDWRCSARKIYNQWRAFQPWPGIFSKMKIKNLSHRQAGKKIKIKFIEIEIAPPIKKDAPGATGEFIKLDKKKLGVKCGDSQIIKILRLQPESKKIMTAEEFMNGYLSVSRLSRR